MTPPPIASPHGNEEPLRAKPPFRGLKVFVGVDAAFLLVGALSSIALSHTHKQQVLTLGVIAVYVSLWGVLLWRLWHGSGVARAVFCWVNGASLLFGWFGNAHQQGVPTATRLFGYVTQTFLIFGLIWLQLPGVKAHFQREMPV